MHHLVSAAEIADMLGVSIQRVHQLAERDDFPEPVAEVTAKRIRVWETAAVKAWERQRRS